MDWNRLLSRRRLGRAAAADAGLADGDARTDFQRDFDRIVFSSALRRLQDKAQVFPLAQNDYVRTRLTHSLEVASVGRTLGVMAGDDVIRRYRLAGVHAQDIGAIVAAACLAHDIGNPPFGHAGEDAIRLWFAESAVARRALRALPEGMRDDFLRFEGNAQGFRVLARLQSRDNPGGMQLTCATLGAFSKYPCDSRLGARAGTAGAVGSAAFRKFGYCQADAALFAAVAGELGLTPLAGCPGAWQRHPLAYLVEAADDICYLVVDVEDACRLRRLSYDDALALLGPLLRPGDRDRLSGLDDDKSRVELLRAKAIGRLVDQVRRCFLDHETVILAGRFDGELLQRIADREALQAIQHGARERIYFSPEVVEVGAAGFQVLGGLLEAFVAAVVDGTGSARSRMLRQLLPRQFGGGAEPAAGAGEALYRRLLGVTDFVAGMTDSYAVKLYRKITGISLPGLG